MVATGRGENVEQLVFRTTDGNTISTRAAAKGHALGSRSSDPLNLGAAAYNVATVIVRLAESFQRSTRWRAYVNTTF